MAKQYTDRVEAMSGMVTDLTPDAARMKAAAGVGYATATDLADWLVRIAVTVLLSPPPGDLEQFLGELLLPALSPKPRKERR